MTQFDEKTIRETAYYIWKNNGCPANSIGRAVPWKSFIRRDRQRSYPPAGITATKYQCIRLCKKHQDSVVQRDAQAISGTDQTVYLWGRYLVLEPQLLYRNYRKCFS